MEKKPLTSLLSLIVVIVIIAGMLAISLYSIHGAVIAYFEGNLNDAVFSGLFGAVGIGISIYISLMLGRRRFTRKPPLRVITTVECKKCGFKSLNTFKRDDYVFKTVENCKKCNEPMLVTAIYVEDIKKK